MSIGWSSLVLLPDVMAKLPIRQRSAAHGASLLRPAMLRFPREASPRHVDSGKRSFRVASAWRSSRLSAVKIATLFTLFVRRRSIRLL
jgi:hypothetical protein